MFKIVAASNKSQFCRHYIYFSVLDLMHFDTLRLMQLHKYAPNKVVQKLFDSFILIVAEVIIIGVSEDTSEEETPSYPLNAILSIVDVATSYFCVDMIV